MTQQYDPRVHEIDWYTDRAFIETSERALARRAVMDEFTGVRIGVVATIGPEGRAWAETYVSEDTPLEGRIYVVRNAFRGVVEELERRYRP